MIIEIKVPQLPESIVEATIAKWHKQKGDFVMRDENLVDLETCKVMLEMPAPATGVLGDILEQEGTTVTAGTLLTMLNESND